MITRTLAVLAGALALGGALTQTASAATRAVAHVTIRGAGTVTGYTDSGYKSCAQSPPVSNQAELDCETAWSRSDTNSWPADVSLTAEAAQGWKFDSWQGCDLVDPWFPALCWVNAARGTIREAYPKAVFVDDAEPVAQNLRASFPATDEGTVTVTWDESEPGVDWRCSTDDRGYGACSSPYTLRLPEGGHGFAVKGTDPSGNASPPHKIPIDVVDTRLTVGPEQGAYVATGASAFVAATGFGQSFECSLDGRPYATCGLPGADGSASLTVPAVADGDHTLRVRARHVAAVDATPVVRSWTVDTVAPDTTIAAGFALQSSEPASLRCRLDGAAPAPCASPYALPDLSAGPHTLEAVAVDRAGNADPTPATHSWTIPVAVAAAPGQPSTSTTAPIPSASAPGRPSTSTTAPIPSAAAPRLAFGVSYRFRSGRFTRLSLTGLPKGTAVRVTVSCPRKRGCPRGGSLARLVGKRLAPGTKITVRAAGATRVITIRRGRAPRVA